MLVIFGIEEGISNIAKLAWDIKYPEASWGLFPFWGI